MNSGYIKSRLHSKYLYNFLLALAIFSLGLNYLTNNNYDANYLRKTHLKSDNKYSYYLLAVQKWCSKDYQIHGLWPQYDHNTWPSFCENVKYKMPTGDLLKKMNENWSSCDDNSNLWKHEWQKHGSCVEKQIGSDENSYFKLAIDLFKNNKELLNNCSGRDCTMGCFDLEGNYIECP